ncbi:MAG: indole-3-glycerol phosphate synthase TrpC [Tannerella sp.]|jgi:indole-3-glycerol phosphate synthase|nr:indole-3-glycerol phosphate synthase TrpC [Tannerella sp.]
MDILEKIVTNKLNEVSRQKKAVPLELLLSSGEQRLNRPIVSMRSSLSQSKSGIIAEFKRRSPSKGWLHRDAKIDDVLTAYEQNGASACSILTDGDFFGGSFSDLTKARALVRLPLIRKDFIIDDYQLYQARVMGADAVLLIAACLTRSKCRNLAATAHRLGMEVLLEIHSEYDLSYLNPNIDMIGVNNRNLGTFDTDVENSFRMIEKINPTSDSPLLVSESGISDPALIRRLRSVGYRGFLIGETFMKTPRPGDALLQFINQLSQSS